MICVSDYSFLCSWVFKVDGAQCFRLQFVCSWVFKVDGAQCFRLQSWVFKAVVLCVVFWVGV